MKNVLASVLKYLATNKKARAAEYALVLGIFQAVRSALGHP